MTVTFWFCTLTPVSGSCMSFTRASICKTEPPGSAEQHRGSKRCQEERGALTTRSPLPSQATGPAERLTVKGREETPQEAGGGVLLLDSGGDRGASGCRRHHLWTHASP